MTKPNIVKQNIAGVDQRINELINQLAETSKGSEDYEKITKNLETLVDIRDDLTITKHSERFKGINVDTLVNGTISLVTIYAIMKYEKTDIITTKAMSIAGKWLGK